MVILTSFETENGDHIVDYLMECHMVSWISENLKELDIKTELISLLICVPEQYDFPHPRHLCFKYPFGKSSFKKHCKKCYCYVCEELAPCSKWNRSTKKHCQATDNAVWKSEKRSRKRLGRGNLTMARHTLTVSFMHYPSDQTVLIEGSAGGMITDSHGNWVTGFSVRIVNVLGRIDSSVPPYIALTEALQLAWSRGFRFLNVQLGYLYHEGFCEDFKRDTSTSKYRLQTVDLMLKYKHRAWSTLREVETLINQDWFVRVNNSTSIEDEAGALALAMVACSQPRKQVYDFPSHPLTPMIKSMAQICRGIKVPSFNGSGLSDLPDNIVDDLKTYFRSN